MNFKASLDKLAVIITVVVTIIIGVLIIANILFLDSISKHWNLFITFLLLLIYFGSFIFRPMYYVVKSNEVIIYRLIKSVKIKRNDIISVEIIDKQRTAGTIRTFGVGGLFGYYGKFWNKNLGSMQWYATQRINYILITTSKNKKIILTPDEPVVFADQFNR